MTRSRMDSRDLRSSLSKLYRRLPILWVSGYDVYVLLRLRVDVDETVRNGAAVVYCIVLIELSSPRLRSA